ncbi:hypothetical protein MNBD_GAMMA12-1048 [hydrothermal vent metagenome]|uniref:Zinc resistance-associated protein n=1 Tax=hydrothermal vent metagenome TaxID=652676 RepID=A0A3B0YMU1_9ZZZZ
MNINMGLKVFISLTLLTGMSSAVMAEKKSGGYHGHKGHHGHKGYHKTLSKEQKEKLAKLGIAHGKFMTLHKAKKQRLKLELALLITSDKPNAAAIAKKIGQLATVVKTVISSAVKHKIAVRTILTVDQRTRFDMRIFKMASSHHGGHHKKHHGCHKKHHGHHKKHHSGYHAKRHGSYHSK